MLYCGAVHCDIARTVLVGVLLCCLLMSESYLPHHLGPAETLPCSVGNTSRGSQQVSGSVLGGHTQ